MRDHFEDFIHRYEQKERGRIAAEENEKREKEAEYNAKRRGDRVFELFFCFFFSGIALVVWGLATGRM